MNPLEEASYNSVQLIDERLKKLQEEVAQIEQEYGQLSELEPLPPPKPISYSDLPPLDPEPPKKPQVKPQITEQYTRTLQYAPEIMQLYQTQKQEPEFVQDLSSLKLAPKPSKHTSLLFSYLDKQVLDFCS
mmetsp:Transcript_15901/g.23047  ORF Transcript_15901/g.23047 Transcript_15901/m.23047 type:complete len:131 (-) Transcript_15901:47-439(-)